MHSAEGLGNWAGVSSEAQFHLIRTVQGIPSDRLQPWERFSNSIAVKIPRRIRAEELYFACMLRDAVPQQSQGLGRTFREAGGGVKETAPH